MRRRRDKKKCKEEEEQKRNNKLKYITPFLARCACAFACFEYEKAIHQRTF